MTPGSRFVDRRFGLRPSPGSSQALVPVTDRITSSRDLTTGGYLLGRFGDSSGESNSGRVWWRLDIDGLEGPRAARFFDGGKIGEWPDVQRIRGQPLLWDSTLKVVGDVSSALQEGRWASWAFEILQAGCPFLDPVALCLWFTVVRVLWRLLL